MLARGRWFEVVPFLGEGPLPPFGEAFEGQRVQMLELRQAAAAGDAARVRDTLQADLAFWREVLKSSDILISKMIACSAIRNHFFFGNLVLRRMPPALQAEAIPPLWRQPLSTEEKSMFRAMAGEFEYARGRVEWLRSADAGYEEFDEEYEEDLVDEWLGKIGHRVRPWQRQLNHVADAYLGLAEAFTVPLDQYQRAEINFAERFADNPVGNRITTYALRVGSVEGMRRAALLTAELRSRAVPEVGGVRRGGGRKPEESLHTRAIRMGCRTTRRDLRGPRETQVGGGTSTSIEPPRSFWLRRAFSSIH